jgi:NAD(P)-dependent dehydrogenase (short-subunit alcohol dehydrogenase family)
MNQKVAFVTGAAKRIGKKLCQHLAQKGYSVAMHYNQSEKEIRSLQDELKKEYPMQSFHVYSCNLSNLKACEKLVDEVLQDYQQIDLLVNNASVFDSGLIKETSVELLCKQMDINFSAPFLLSRDYARRNQKGLIVNFLDTRITGNSTSHAAYSISKVAFAHLTKMSALEFAPSIRVNGIAPGATLAPEDESEDYLQRIAAKTPMKRPSGLQPILQSLDYIINNENLTGQILFCDGGEQLL